MPPKATRKEPGQKIRKQEKGKAAASRAAARQRTNIPQWHPAFDVVSDAIWIVGHDQRVLNANGSAEKIFNMPAAEMMGKQCWKILGCSEKAVKQCSAEGANAGGIKGKFDFRIDNDCFQVTVTPVLDADGSYLGATHIAKQITGHGNTDSPPQESKSKYYTLFRKMLEGCALHEIICNEEGLPVDYRYLDVNPAFERLTGFKAADVVGKTALETRPEMDPFFIETYGRVALNGTPVTFDFSNPVTGRHFVISAYQPEERQFACVFQDVTELKKTEKALRESEQKFRLIAESQVAGIFVTQDGKIVEANDRLAEMHGYIKEEIIGLPDYMLIHPSERKTIRARMHKQLMTPPKDWQRFKILRLRKNEESFWGGLIATRGSYNGKPAIFGSIVDITKTVLAEEDIKKTRDELETRVQERTRELQKANDDLNEKTKNLEDLNIALKILLDKREKDKEESGEQILLNVKEFLIPYVMELKNGPLTERQRNYIQLLESGLHEIISPFAQKLTSRYMHITPREMQVANLVKEGKTSKEIALILCTTERTVVAHRANLRKKLGLKKKSNLRTYLLSLN